MEVYWLELWYEGQERPQGMNRTRRENKTEGTAVGENEMWAAPKRKARLKFIKCKSDHGSFMLKTLQCFQEVKQITSMNVRTLPYLALPSTQISSLFALFLVHSIPDIELLSIVCFHLKPLYSVFLPTGMFFTPSLQGKLLGISQVSAQELPP